MIKVLVVDDSAFMRQLFKKSINKDPDLQVIDTARNGKQALEYIKKLKPDVVTLDIEMPVKNGLDTLQEIIEQGLEPAVIMVSALDNRETVMQALEIGAFDFIPKPSGSISLNIDDIIDELREKIKASVEAEKPSSTIKKTKSAPQKCLRCEVSTSVSRETYPVIAIGASSGGPRALKEVIAALPADLPAALAIVQHMPAGFTTTLAQRLDNESNLEVIEASNGDKLKPGRAILAPGDYHLIFNHKGEARLNQEPKKWGVRPCVDHMLESLAPVFKERIIGVILTGMGHDGGEGMKKVKENQGYGLVEDKSTALVYGMPGTTIKAGAYDEILPRPEIPSKLVNLIERRLS